MKYESNVITQDFSPTLLSPESNIKNNIEWTEYTSPTNFRRTNKCDTPSVPASLPSPSTRGRGTRADGQPAVSTNLNQDATSTTENGLSTTPKSSIDEPAQTEPAQPAEEHIELSAEQESVLAMVNNKENVFFTGPAGTGKSVLLREIIKSLRGRGGSVAVTAPTGIAGLNIGGRTIHSFAGIGLGTEPADQLANKILGSKRLTERWRNTSILIIDEISMLDALLFDKLEYIARVVRESRKPFGGIQLVLSGDFFQLPPVPQQSHKFFLPAKYAFDAQSWGKCVGNPVLLRRVFRQKDNDFVEILSAMRNGELTENHISKLQSLSRPLIYSDGIEPSQLFPLRAEVENCNNKRLDELTGSIQAYEAMDSSGYDVHGTCIPFEQASQLLQRLVAPQDISLKVGAQVMLIQNVMQGQLVNGSVGKVADFLTTGQALARQIEIATIQQQNGQVGKTVVELPLAPVSLVPMRGKVFEKKQKWPLVHFTNGMDLLCAPLAFTIEGFVGNIEAHRLQVPLILAWALSIHKSQGQTLSRVKVDLKRIFEKGQAYVALSRATTMESLEIQNFHPSRIMAHPRVVEWQKTWMKHDEDSNEYGVDMDCDEAIASYHSCMDMS